MWKQENGQQTTTKNCLQTKGDFLPPIGFIRWPPVTSPEIFFGGKKFPAVFEFVVCNRFLLLLDVQSSAEMTRSAGAQWTPRRCGRRLRPKIIGNTLAQNRIALFHILAL